MPRDWSDVFLLADGDAAAATADAGPEQRRGFFRRLRENLSKTRVALQAEVQATLFETLDDETWERLEEALIMADVGATTTAKVVAQLEQEAESGEVEGGEALTARLVELLADLARPGEGRIDLRHEPTVIMVAGVNGTGKTTTIGKLAWHLRQELGRQVVLGAADTFRAAAVEQLEEWSRRADVGFVRGEPGSDPASVAFEAVRQGRERGADVVIVDTAGRLHTQDELMAELAKVRRVIGKQLEGAPHETLLTVDATTGQNGLRQAQLFSATVPVDGIVLTKLDGTAKGGIALAIAGELGLPVKLIGIGERLEDLRPFDADDFAARPRPPRPTDGGGTLEPGMDAWVFWAIAAVILAVGEVLTVSFFLFPFALGLRRGGARRPRGRRLGAPGRGLRRPDGARPRRRPAHRPPARDHAPARCGPAPPPSSAAPPSSPRRSTTTPAAAPSAWRARSGARGPTTTTRSSRPAPGSRRRHQGRHGARHRIGAPMAALIAVVVLVLFAIFLASRTIRIIPQARAGVVERLGRYSRTLTPGLTIVSRSSTASAPSWTSASRS